MGFGDIVPHTSNEKIFTIVVQMAGSLMFGLLMGATLGPQDSSYA